MLESKPKFKILAIAFIIASFITWFCAYSYFSPQFNWLGYGVLHFKVNGYILPVWVNSEVMVWFYLFGSILFFIGGMITFAVYLILPTNLTPDYEQYLYPSSTDNKTNSL
jgi:hypothetical protein